MALNFPVPTEDGQIYEQFYWDDAAGIWRHRVVTAELDDLADVEATSPSDTYILVYNQEQDKWIASEQPPPPLATVFLLMGA